MSKNRGKVSKMINDERENLIINYLRTKKTASVKELANTLFVSEATIRRDLNDLQKTGIITRSHGGAVITEEHDETALTHRHAKNAREKDQVATIALRHLPDFQTIFIDNSSTCLALAERLNLTRKTVITNGLTLASHLAQRDNSRVVILGGDVIYHTTAVMGSTALNTLHNYRFDMTLCSCAAIDKEGAYEFSSDSAEIKSTALQKSRTKVLLFDRTKIGTFTTYRSAELNYFDLIITNASKEEVESLFETVTPSRIIHADF